MNLFFFPFHLLLAQETIRMCKIKWDSLFEIDFTDVLYINTVNFIYWHIISDLPTSVNIHRNLGA